MLACQRFDRCLWLQLMHCCCCSCGAMTHKTKDCVDRPRKVGARWSNKHIAADEKIESIDMKGFEAKRDRWTGYDSKEYSRVIDTCVPRPRPDKPVYLGSLTARELLQAVQAAQLSRGTDPCHIPLWALPLHVGSLAGGCP